MNLKTLFCVLIAIFALTSCTSNPEDKIEFIEGYWEITEVRKDDKLIKEYNINLSIDYFEVREDLSGFRKKVSPAFNGTYLVSKHSSPFNLKIENDSLNIYYNYNDVITKETIIKASSKELIIVNPQDFTYIYKPFKNLNIE